MNIFSYQSHNVKSSKVGKLWCDLVEYKRKK
jgi:hypothetical protein